MDIPGSPDKYYANVNTALNMTKNSLYVTETLLSDALLVKLSVYHSLLCSYCVITGVSNIRCLGQELLGSCSSYYAICFGLW
jgi:hypothetical protein